MYNREKAVAYAQKWAYSRNPTFADFEEMGGDCTNFISQCIYAGSGVMNYTPVTGWYFKSLNNRALAWTGVEYLYNFLTKNTGPGPYGVEVRLSEIEIGDVIQLKFFGMEQFTHSLLVVNRGNIPTRYNVRVAAHSYDVYNKRLAGYFYEKVRFIHINGVRN